MNGLIRAVVGVMVVGLAFACDVSEEDELRDEQLVDISEIDPDATSRPDGIEPTLVTVIDPEGAIAVALGCSASAGSCSCDGTSCGAWTDDDGHEHALCYDNPEKTEGTRCFAGANGGPCSCSPVEKPEPKPVGDGG